MALKIALTGKMFSGKTTVARLLETHGFYFIDYTGLLKRFAAQAIELATGVPVTQEYIATHKRDYRAFLQAYGSALRFEDGFGVQQVVQEWRDAGASPNVVFDNIRSYKQFEVLRSLEPKYLLVGLPISDELQYERARAQGIGYSELDTMKQHHIETVTYPEISIDGAHTPEYIVNILLRMAA